MVVGGGPLWQVLADRLAGEITNGQRLPGSRLPSVSQLRQESVSQTTALRAYRELIDRGLARSVHGSGVFVVDELPPAGASTLEERVTELQTRVAMLESEQSEDRELLGTLQARLMELYSRTGNPYPGEPSASRGRKRRTS